MVKNVLNQHGVQMRIKINVKNKYIEKGVRNSFGRCPIALAITDQCKPIKGIAVEVCGGVFCNDNIMRWQLPRSARRFINKFDTNKVVEPFSFYLQDV